MLTVVDVILYLWFQQCETETIQNEYGVLDSWIKLMEDQWQSRPYFKFAAAVLPLSFYRSVCHMSLHPRIRRYRRSKTCEYNVLFHIILVPCDIFEWITLTLIIPSFEQSCQYNTAS